MAKQIGRRYCMQLSVDAARWPDSMLAGALRRDGKSLTGPDVRAALREMKARGLEVVPCGQHTCDTKGECQGEPSKA